MVLANKSNFHRFPHKHILVPLWGSFSPHNLPNPLPGSAHDMLKWWNKIRLTTQFPRTSYSIAANSTVGQNLSSLKVICNVKIESSHLLRTLHGGKNTQSSMPVEGMWSRGEGGGVHRRTGLSAETRSIQRDVATFSGFIVPAHWSIPTQGGLDS